MANMFLFALNDHFLKLENFRDIVSGDVISNATVTVTLQRNGVDLPGTVWPLTMDPQDTAGEYGVVLPSTLNVSIGDHLRAIVNVDANGTKAHWNTNVLVVRRR
jgi:hypothetical protein